MNDTTTAVNCVDYLSAILKEAALRHIEKPYRFDHGQLRVIARGPDFNSLVEDALDPIRRYANYAIYLRLIKAVEVLGTHRAHRIDEIDHEAEAGWSVVAFGRIERPSDVDEVWDIHGWRNPTPWSGDHRNFHLKLRWSRLTGRRLEATSR